jgi:hypothetical protein
MPVGRREMQQMSKTASERGMMFNRKQTALAFDTKVDCVRGLRLRRDDEQTTRSRIEVLFQGNAVMEETGLMMV